MKNIYPNGGLVSVCLRVIAYLVLPKFCEKQIAHMVFINGWKEVKSSLTKIPK